MEDTTSQASLQEFDVAIIGGDIASAILAFNCSANGLRVALLKEGDLKREPVYSWSHLMPQSILKMPGARLEAEITLSLRNMAPHLCLPQKIIYPRQYFGGKFIFPIHNTWLKKGELGKIAQLKLNGHGKAWMAQEYRMNVTRYVMGFIKAAKVEGTEVYIDCKNLQKETKGNENILKGYHKGNPFFFRTKHLIESEKWPSDYVASFNLPKVNMAPTNPIRTCKKDLSLIFFREKEIWKTRIECMTSALPLSLIEQEIMNLFPEASHLKLYENKHKTCSSRFFNLVYQYVEEELTKISKLFPLYSDIKLNDIKMSGGSIGYNNLWRSVSEYCDSRYDEAKETNISAEDFRELFFLYGNEIVEMTEKAYELMNQSRDTEWIWKTVEEEFLVRNEWKPKS